MKNTNVRTGTGTSKGTGTKSHHGFTLVELIVVITILAILGTIAFTQMNGYSGSARDSQRVSDLANISQWLDLTYIKLSSYPTPDNAINITYSGWVLWYQWTVWDTVMNILWANGAKLSKKPTDPLSPTQEYTYSKTANSNYSYQLKTDYEWDSVSFIPLSYAASNNPTISYIKGTYNWVVAKTITGSITYIIATPSIITSQTGTIGSNFEITTLPNKLLVHGQTNSGGIAFTGKLVYSSGALPSTDPERLTFATSLANIYSGTIVASNPNIQQFITALNPLNNTTLTTLGWYAVVNWLGGIMTSAVNNDGWWGGGCTSWAYSTSTTYTTWQCFTYTLPSGSVISIDVIGPGYGTVAGTKTLHIPACDTDDIAIWQNGTTNVQIWAACNVGASVVVPYASSTGVVTGNVTPDATEKTRIGNFYQWGNNGDITNAVFVNSGWPICSELPSPSTYSQTTSFYTYSDFINFDWCTGVSNDNLWWNTTNTSIARKWPCPTGYHVPTWGTTNTSTEWGTAYTIANNMTTLGDCNQATGTQPYNRLRCAMMIPLSGTRSSMDGSWFYQGVNSYYWSSSPINTPAYFAQFQVDNGNIANSYSRAEAYNVRCIKN